MSVRLVIVLVVAGAFGLDPLLGHAQGRPFCMFSEDGWSDEPTSSGYVEYVTHKATRSDPSGVPQVVETIKEVLDVRAEFDVYIAKDERNAMAAVAGGRKILVVDVEFLEWINRVADTEWGAIQVVAHEVGHHIAGFSRNSHENELNADYWSGYILRKLRAGRPAAVAAILAVGTDEDTRSHPSKFRRRDTIWRGWSDADEGRTDYSYCDGCQ